MTHTPALRILLLGTPAVFYQNQPLSIQRRVMRWMLFYLACQKEMVGRADLMLLFWPDEAEEDARRHLRETLSKLRAQLPDPDLIITEQDRVGLDANRVYCDARVFESLTAQTARACAQTPAATPLTQSVYQKVVEAVRLWRSARFLSGASLPDSETLSNWLLSTSQQMEAQYQRLLERLVDHDLAGGDMESAQQWLRSAIDADETNESLHFRLLTLLHKQGRYSEALNYCNYVQELFKREGYSELPPALLNLARKIREAAGQPSDQGSEPAWPTLADMQVPFIGRQALLKEMQFAVRRGGPIILFGEAGSGKSRLVRELFFSLKPAPRLMMAPARIMEIDLPFQPIIDLLRHDIRSDEWKQMDLTWATPLAMLLPELSILRPEIPALRVSASQQYSLVFEALHQLFRFLSQRHRFLLFLDNAQWSDSATLAALAYLAERGLFDENGTLILAARQEDSAPQLNDFLNRPSSAFSVQRLTLPPLNSEETAGIAHSVLGESFNPNILPRLEADTGGNPLFLLETLRLVLDRSFDPHSGQAADRLPLASSVMAVIRERLQHLTPYDAQVLSTAAVIAEIGGGEFALDLLESTCMLPPEQVAHSVESLVQSNLIRAVLKDRPSSGYTFVHAKIREVILLDLSPARRRLFHLRVARALEQKPPGQSSEVETSLAIHYEEAGELDSAIQHWLRAALFAWQLNEKDRAVESLQHGENILNRLGHQASDILIYQVYRQWGRLAYDIGDPEMVDQIYQRLLQYGKNRQNPLLAGSAYNGLAQAAELRRLPEEGQAHIEKAVRYLDQVGRLFEHIETLNRRGLFQVQLGQYADAQETFQKALALGEQAADNQSLEARSFTTHWIARLMIYSGWPLLGLEMARRSYSDAEETFNHIRAARALDVQASAEVQLGRYAQSLGHTTQGLNTALAVQIPHLLSDLHSTAAQACLALGDLDACWDHIQEALQPADQEPHADLKETIQIVFGQLLYFLEDYDQCAEIHRMGSLLVPKTIVGLTHTVYLASALIAQGQAEAGLALVEPIIALPATQELMRLGLSAQQVKAQGLISLNRLEEAGPILEAITTEAARRSLAEIQIRGDLLRAALALNNQRPVECAQICQAAAAAAGAISHRPLEIECCLLEAKSAHQAGMDFNPVLDHLQTLTQELLEHTHHPHLTGLLMKKLASVDTVV